MFNLVSRLAYDTVLSECLRLREQNDRLLDMVWRLSRKEAGLSEVQPEKRQPEEHFPAAVLKAVNAWESDHIRARMLEKARAGFRQTKDWNAVLEMLALPQTEEEE